MINYNEELQKISPYDYSLKSVATISTNENDILTFVDYEKQYKIK